MNDQHFMFIEQQFWPELELMTQDWDRVVESALREFERPSRAAAAAGLAFRNYLVELVRTFVRKTIRDILLRDIRANAKRKAAARARCGYKRRQR